MARPGVAWPGTAAPSGSRRTQQDATVDCCTTLPVLQEYSVFFVLWLLRRSTLLVQGKTVLLKTRESPVPVPPYILLCLWGHRTHSRTAGSDEKRIVCKKLNQKQPRLCVTGFYNDTCSVTILGHGFWLNIVLI